MNKYCIYKHINKNNEIIYIGLTSNLKQRQCKHLKESQHKQEIFRIEYAECQNKTAMILYEQYYINKYNPKYNKKDKRNDDVSFLHLKELDFKDYNESNVCLDFGIKFKNGYRHSNINCEINPNFSNKTYYYYFMEIISMLEPYTNKIKHNNKYINMTEISKIINVSIKTMSIFLKECNEKNIIKRIYKDDNFDGYYFNPLYAYCGSKIDKFTYDIFKMD